MPYVTYLYCQCSFLNLKNNKSILFFLSSFFCNVARTKIEMAGDFCLCENIHLLQKKVDNIRYDVFILIKMGKNYAAILLYIRNAF